MAQTPNTKFNSSSFRNSANENVWKEWVRERKRRMERNTPPPTSVHFVQFVHSIQNNKATWCLLTTVCLRPLLKSIYAIQNYAFKPFKFLRATYKPKRYRQQRYWPLNGQDVKTKHISTSHTHLPIKDKSAPKLRLVSTFQSLYFVPLLKTIYYLDIEELYDMYCTAHQVLLGWSNQRQWDGSGT